MLTKMKEIKIYDRFSFEAFSPRQRNAPLFNSAQLKMKTPQINKSLVESNLLEREKNNLKTSDFHENRVNLPSCLMSSMIQLRESSDNYSRASDRVIHLAANEPSEAVNHLMEQSVISEITFYNILIES